MVRNLNRILHRCINITRLWLMHQRWDNWKVVSSSAIKRQKLPKNHSVTSSKVDLRNVWRITIRIFSYLTHSILIWFFLWIRPINNNITAPDLNTTGFQTAFGKTSRFVGFIFQEAKSTILLLVIRRTVDNDLPETS